MQAPALARYMPKANYVPDVGDFVIWSGWFKTWYGVVSETSADGKMVSIVFEGLPSLLFTSTEPEQLARTHQIPLSQIINSMSGTWALQKHDTQHNATIWFI